MRRLFKEKKKRFEPVTKESGVWGTSCPILRGVVSGPLKFFTRILKEIFNFLFIFSVYLQS